MSFSEAWANFARTLDAVVDDAEETVIHRSGHEPVVIISLSEWNAMKETEYLLSDSANAAFLRRSIEELNSGDAVEHELIDPDTAGGAEVARESSGPPPPGSSTSLGKTARSSDGSMR